MRVPVYGPQKAEPSMGGAAHVAPLPVADTAAIAHGLAQVGGAVDQALAEGRRAAEKYKAELEQSQHEADVVAARNAATQLESYDTTLNYGNSAGASTSGQKLSDAGDQGGSQADLGTASPPQQEASPGFLSTRGVAAVGAGAQVYESLEKKRDELAADLKTPRQRELFRQHADQVLLSSKKNIERHTAQQIEVAKEDSVNSAADEAVRAAALDPANDDLARERVAGVVGPIHALAGGRADFAEQKAREVQERVTSTRLDALLAKPDGSGLKDAERIFADQKTVLGVKADDYEKAIRIAQDNLSGEALAASTVDSARKKNGFVDEAKAVAAFESIPAAQRSSAAKTAFDHRMTLERMAEASQKADHFEAALSGYLASHNMNDIPASEKQWLIANDPKGWHALEQVMHADREYARGSPPTDAQRRAMVRFEVDMRDNPDRYAAMGEKEFNATVWPQLATGDRERAGAMFAAAHGKPDKPGTLSAPENDMLLQKGRDAHLFPPKGKDPAQWDGDSADLYYKATETLQAQVRQYRLHSKHHEPPPFELVKQWTDDLVLEGKVPGKGFLGFGGNTTRLEALTKNTDFEPKWTDAQKAEVVKAMRARGIEPTDVKVDTVLRAVHGLPTPPVQEPAAPLKPPSTVSEANDTPDYGLDLSTPDIPAGD